MQGVAGFPERLVCLTEETTETLYLLGEDWRIVGISGFTVRPPQARREKPRVSAFTSAKIDRIVELRPDLVLGFSDLQADIAAALVRAGIEVHIFNHRSVGEILRMIRTLGGMIGCEAATRALIERLESNLEEVRSRARVLARRPRVYFEEWDEPQISGIRWVSELISIAGGEDCFPELAMEPLGRDRIIADPMEVVRRAPDLILGSWCGKKFRPESVAARAGWVDVPAVRSGFVREIKSSLILQPGPAALTDGVRAVQEVIFEWAQTPEALPDATLQAFADTMIPGRKAERTDRGDPIDPRAIAGVDSRPGAVEADVLALYHHPLVGFDALQGPFLTELQQRSLPRGGDFLSLSFDGRVATCVEGLAFSNPVRVIWEAAAAVPFTAFCAAALVPEQRAEKASGYAVMGLPGAEPRGYANFSYRRKLARERTKKGYLP